MLLVSHYKPSFKDLKYSVGYDVHDVASATDAAMDANKAVINALNLNNFMLKIRHGTQHLVAGESLVNAMCANVAMASWFSTILTLDLTKDLQEFESDLVIANKGAIYVSKNNLVIGEPTKER